MTDFSNLKGIALVPSKEAISDAIRRLDELATNHSRKPDRRIIPPDVWDWLQANYPEALR